MTVGFIASSFDLFHAGHNIMLEEAKQNCDYLICAFNVNPENKKCVQSVFERYVQLKNHKCVDEIIPYELEYDLEQMLKAYAWKIDVRFLGSDYIGKDFTGNGIIENVIYLGRDHRYSTTELKQRISRKCTFEEL